MKKSLFLSVLLLFTCSCVKEAISPVGENQVAIGAKFEQLFDTKASETNGVFSWEAEDQIAIAKAEGGFQTYFANKAGATTSFIGEAVTLQKYAVYPSSIATAVESDVLKVTLPSEYELGNQTTTHASMIATFSGSMPSSLSFSHLGALLRFTVNNLPIGSNRLVFETQEGITGEFAVEAVGEKYVINTKTATPSNKSVTVNFDATDEVKSGVVFYIPVPVGTYHGYSVKIYNSADEIVGMTSTSATFALERRTLGTKTLNLAYIPGEFAENPIEVANAEEVAAAFATETGANPELRLVANGAITSWTLPANFTSAETTASELEIVYNSVPESLTIAEAAPGSPIASKGVVTVKIPGGNATAIDVTINTPSLTVVISSSNLSVLNLHTVSSVTATSTFVAKENVSIAELNAKGGNVVVEPKAEVATINVKAEDTNVVVEGTVNTIVAEQSCSVEIAENVTVENLQLSGDAVETVEVSGEGTITNLTADENVKEEAVVVAAEGTNIVNEEVETITPLELLLANGGELTLTSNISLSSPIVIKKNTIINMNGHSITPAETSLTANTATGCTGTRSLIFVARGAALTLNGEGSIDTGNNENIYSAVQLVAPGLDGETGEKAALVVNGPTLKGYYYAIVGNGSRHNTEITLTDGTITSYNGLGIYHPQEGVVNINGGTITANDSAIEMRGGTLNITAGTFTSTATDFTEQANGSGSTIIGAAIAVSQHGTNKNLAVTISGGTFEGIYALYEKDLQDNKVSNISLNVTGGTFNGKVYSQNCSNFITGGNFADFSAMVYGANDFALLNGNYNLPVVSTNASRDLHIWSASQNKAAVSLTIPQNINWRWNSVTIDNITIDRENNNEYGGLIATNGNFTVNNCNIEKVFFCYAQNRNYKVIFNNCTFNQTEGGIYNVWTYGSNADFNNCVFNCAIRSLHIYDEGHNGVQKVNITGCSFNASVGGKAAVQIDGSHFNGTADVAITNCTVNGFSAEQKADGSNLSTDLYNLKNAVTKTRVNLTVNGELVNSIAE